MARVIILFLVACPVASKRLVSVEPTQTLEVDDPEPASTTKSANQSYYSKSSDEYNMQDASTESTKSSDEYNHRSYYSKQDVARSVLDSIDPMHVDDDLQNFIQRHGGEDTNGTEDQGVEYANSTGGGNVVNESSALDRMPQTSNQEGGSIEVKIGNLFEQHKLRSFVLAQLDRSYEELQALKQAVVTRSGIADVNISAGALVLLACACMGGIVLLGCVRYCLKYIANSSIDSRHMPPSKSKSESWAHADVAKKTPKAFGKSESVALLLAKTAPKAFGKLESGAKDSSSASYGTSTWPQANMAKKAPTAFGKMESWVGRQRDMSDRKILAQALLARIGDSKSSSDSGTSRPHARTPHNTVVLRDSSDEESSTGMHASLALERVTQCASQLRPNLLPHLHGENAQPSSEIRYPRTFVAATPDGDERSFRWVSPDEATAAGLLSAGAPVVNSHMASHACIGMQRHEKGVAGPPIPASWTVDAVKRVLLKYEVDVNHWDADRLKKLASELSDQKSFLMVTLSGNLRRVVDFLELMIVHPDNGHVCVSSTISAASTSFRQVKHGASAMPINPWVWKDFGESYQEAAHRCLEKSFGVHVDVIEFDWSKVKSEENEETSDYYPGLTSIVHKRYIAGTVVTKDTKVLASLGIGTEKPTFLVRVGHDVHEWTWKSVEKVPQLIKHRKFLHSSSFGSGSTTISSGRELVKSKWQSGVQAATCAGTSDNLAIVLPWGEVEVEKLLDAWSTKPEDFGMTLQDLTSEVTTGTLYFSRRSSDGQLVCVRDKILVRIISPKGQAVLVEQRKPDSGGTETEVQWPHSLRRINENAWDTGRRIVRTQLRLQDDTVEFYSTPHELPSTGEAARVLSRVWLTSGHIPEAKGSAADNIHASEV